MASAPKQRKGSPAPVRRAKTAPRPVALSEADKAADARITGFDLLSTPGYLLRRTHQRSFEIFQKHVGDGVTRQQYALLLALVQNPGASQNDLVGLTGFDKSTLKEMLGRLVERNWVSRERDPRDSRAWTVRATAAGRRMLLDRFDQVEAAQREILEPLTPKERVQFVRFLRILLGLDPAS